MQLPHERGPVTRRVLETLTGDRDRVLPLALSHDPVLDDPDAQLGLWILYELSFRGFDGVDPDLEWDPATLRLRRSLERRLELELREATTARTASVDRDGDVGEELLALAARDAGPSQAAYLHPHATRDQLVDYLRERSVQQLRESDPQSFVLPRLEGRAKVALAELQYDEYGAGRPERLHQQLYADALVGAGLDASYGAYVEEICALSLASTNVMSMFALNRRLRGAAMGHLAAFEATSSVPSRKVAGGIERLGLPPVVAEYFHEHVEADAVHEHVAAHDICVAMVEDDPGLREDVFFGAAACLHLDAVSGAELLARWTPQEQAS
jgi:hypothetical protein